MYTLGHKDWIEVDHSDMFGFLQRAREQCLVVIFDGRKATFSFRDAEYKWEKREGIEAESYDPEDFMRWARWDGKIFERVYTTPAEYMICYSPHEGVRKLGRSEVDKISHYLDMPDAPSSGSTFSGVLNNLNHGATCPEDCECRSAVGI